VQVDTQQRQELMATSIDAPLEITDNNDKLEQSKPLLLKLTLLLGSTLTIMSGASIAPSLPQIRVEFAHVPYINIIVKTILTIPALFIVLSAPMAGIIIDRFGRKPTILISITIYVLAGSAGFILNSLPALITSRALLHHRRYVAESSAAYRHPCF
jgi:MFS family permease